jgi:RloB-like protein
MTMIQRKPRPLTRDSGMFRDDRLIIVACDDTYAPKQYFGFFRIPRVQVHVVPTEDGSSAARHVLDRLEAVAYEQDDERWLLLDTDHCTEGPHVARFMEALRDAKKKGIRIALSKPCFELWLLLHHAEETTVGEYRSAGDVESALRQRMGQYNKTRLRETDFPLAAIRKADLRAKRLDATVAGGDVPSSNTSRVYLIVQSILGKANLAF